MSCKPSVEELILDFTRRNRYLRTHAVLKDECKTLGYVDKYLDIKLEDIVNDYCWEKQLENAEIEFLAKETPLKLSNDILWDCFDRIVGKIKSNLKDTKPDLISANQSTEFIVNKENKVTDNNNDPSQLIPRSPQEVMAQKASQTRNRFDYSTEITPNLHSDPITTYNPITKVTRKNLVFQNQQIETPGVILQEEGQQDNSIQQQQHSASETNRRKKTFRRKPKRLSDAERKLKDATMNCIPETTIDGIFKVSPSKAPVNTLAKVGMKIISSMKSCAIEKSSELPSSNNLLGGLLDTNCTIEQQDNIIAQTIDSIFEQKNQFDDYDLNELETLLNDSHLSMSSTGPIPSNPISENITPNSATVQEFMSNNNGELTGESMPLLAAEPQINDKGIHLYEPNTLIANDTSPSVGNNQKKLQTNSSQPISESNVENEQADVNARKEVKNSNTTKPISNTKPMKKIAYSKTISKNKSKRKRKSLPNGKAKKSKSIIINSDKFVEKESKKNKSTENAALSFENSNNPNATKLSKSTTSSEQSNLSRTDDQSSSNSKPNKTKPKRVELQTVDISASNPLLNSSFQSGFAFAQDKIDLITTSTSAVPDVTFSEHGKQSAGASLIQSPTSLVDKHKESTVVVHNTKPMNNNISKTPDSQSELVKTPTTTSINIDNNDKPTNNTNEKTNSIPTKSKMDTVCNITNTPEHIDSSSSVELAEMAKNAVDFVIKNKGNLSNPATVTSKNKENPKPPQVLSLNTSSDNIHNATDSLSRKKHKKSSGKVSKKKKKRSIFDVSIDDINKLINSIHSSPT